jgi:TatD DNase family protein
MLHDTHGHLELLLEKLEILPHNTRDLTDLALDSAQQIYLNNLLKQHDFFVQAGLCTANFKLVTSLFSPPSKIYFLLGTHPEIVDAGFDIADYLQEQEEFLLLHPTLFTDPVYRTVGIGEIGLDYYHTTDPAIHKKQQEVFRAQIELAIRHHQPIQIHTRNAFGDTLSILKEYPEIHGRFEIHCYSEGVDELRQVLELGGMIGIGGVSTYKNAQNVRDAVAFCPLDSFVMETDLPFLAPPPHRGKSCLPEYISLIADNMAQLKNTTTEKIWEHAAANAARLFPSLAKIVVS